MKVLWLVLFSALHFGACLALDLHLEGSDAGFFFQQSLGSSQQPLLKFPTHSYSSNASAADPPPLLRERLAVLGPSAQPGRILVTYGPFEAKQSLPTKYLTLSLENATESGAEQATLMDITAHVVNSELRRESPVLRVLFHSGRHFHSPGQTVEEDPDRSAGPVAPEEWEDEPNGRLMETCIALRVHNPTGGTPLTGTCVPQGLDGVCLAYLTLPFDWWASSPISPTFPSLNAGILGLQQHPIVTAKPSKAVRNVVELSYAVYETKAGQCGYSDPSSSYSVRAGHQKSQQQSRASSSTASSFPPPSAVLIQPYRPINSIRLLPNVYAPRDLLVHEEVISLSPTLRFIASAAPLYPHSYFYVTVLLDSTTAKDEPYAVIVRAKVKNGLKIISTQTTNPAWSLNFDVNGKHIAAAVSAVRNFSVSTQPHQPSQELFTWLLAVNVDHHRDSSELGDGVRALWSWTIRTQSASPPLPSSISGHHHHANNKDSAGAQLDEVKGKLTSRFEVLKDEVQSVFPIIKRRDLVNTAILTSRQVSEPLRVFMVTQAGKVADVTLQATCSSVDESVLKVSSSCTSVYLDGSEVRGSTNATLVARYGNVESTSSLTVWVPEMPLDIQLDDVKLNQISGWKVMASNSGATGGNQCRLRYQQSSFEVFARFYAEDHDSGRVSYLISRKTYLLITDLVRKVMRVADPRVAVLKMMTGYIEGLKPGKTEVQVLSPMSGHVIAAREVRVLSDKVDVSSLSVRLIAGLSLSLTPDPDLDSCFVAQVDANDRLHSRYQEAILDMTVHFSDGTASPLRLTDRSHYNLVVESHNTTILALTSPARANIPRVLALGEGRASLSVTFSSACTATTTNGQQEGDGSHHRQAPAHPLATTVAVIQLALNGHPATSVQNDARTESSGQMYTLAHGGHVGNANQINGDSRRNGGGGKMAAASAGNAGRLGQPNQGQLTFSKPGSIEFGVNENQLSLKDDSNAVMMSNAGRDMQHAHPAYPASSHYPGGGSGFSSSSFQHMGPLEIGMYVLLAIFCAAIVVFVGTCIVYASRARKGLIPTDDSDRHIDRQAQTIDPWPSLWNRLKKMNPKGAIGGGDGHGRQRAMAADENEDEEEGADKGWIWLGRSTLDPEVPRRPVSSAATRPVSLSANPDPSHRLSGISYAGSEVSVRIVGRPTGPDGSRLSYKAQLCFEPLKDTADDGDIDHIGDANHPNSWPGSVDSKTFTKNNAGASHHHPGALRITTNQLAAAAAEEPLLSDVVRRPSNNRRAARRASEQDTRRYARSWLMAGEAIPRDFNSNPSIITDSDAEEELEHQEPNSKNFKLELDVDDTDNEYNVATFLRHGSPDIKQANIIENPRFSPTTTSTTIDPENNTELCERAVGGQSESAHPAATSPLDVDYDRIISYLGILKETST